MNLLIMILLMTFASSQMVEIRRPEFAGQVEKKLAKVRTSKASVCGADGAKAQASAPSQTCTVSSKNKDSVLNKASVSSTKPTGNEIKSKTR